MSLQTVKTQSKYGLINKKVSSSNDGSQGLKPKLVTKKSSIFLSEDDLLEADDDDNDEGDRNNKRITFSSSKGNTKNRNEISNVNNLINSATSKLYDSEMDQAIFDYDGEYDNFKKQQAVEQVSRLSSNQPSVKPQYITNLMNMAKVREKEKERIFERKLLKERTVEDEQFPDQPKFITTAYKNKLLEEKKWNYEDQLAEEVEKRTDVRGSGMSGFYANLLTKNIAMGGDVTASAVSAYTAGSQRQQSALSSSSSSSSSSNNELKGNEVDSRNEIHASSASSLKSDYEDVNYANHTDHADADLALPQTGGKRAHSPDSGVHPHKATALDSIELRQQTQLVSTTAAAAMPPQLSTTASAADKSATAAAVVESAKARYLARKLQQEQQEQQE